MRLVSVKSLLDVAVEKWWLIYGLSLALYFLWVALTGWGPPTPKPDDEVVFYPWIMFQGRASDFAIVALVGLILGCLFYALKKQSLTVPLILAAVTLCGWISLLYWTVPIVGRINNNPITHLDSLIVDGRFYNLAKYNAMSQVTGWLGARYVLYECDGLRLNCLATYRYTPQSLEEEYSDGEYRPSISFDGTNISIHIAGKVVYVHPISNS